MAVLRFRNVLLALCALLGLGVVTGCVHRIDIQQGNFLDAKDIDRVAVGMTRIQVRALLGTPMVADPFTTERWDYLYYNKKGRWKKPEKRHFIVFFADDKVTRIERSDQAGPAKVEPPKTEPAKAEPTGAAGDQASPTTPN